MKKNNLLFQLSESCTSTYKLTLTEEGSRQYKDLKTQKEQREFIMARFRDAKEIQQTINDKPVPKLLAAWSEE